MPGGMVCWPWQWRPSKPLDIGQKGRSLFEYRLPLVFGFFVPHRIHHLVSGVGGKSDLVVVHKAPVEAIEGAGVRGRCLRHTVVAIAAVVAHFFDVVAAGCVGFGAHDAIIGKLAHAPGIRQLHPLDGVDVDAQVPTVDLIGVYSGEKAEITRDHQALDVVGIGHLKGLGDGLSEAMHPGLSGPEPGRQSASRSQAVTGSVFGHVGPVNTTNELPPSKDLPHKPFHLCQVHPGLSGVVVLNDRVDHVLRAEHFAV